MTTLQVHYTNPDQRDLRFGDPINPARLAETHTKVADYLVPDFDLISLKEACERCYEHFQAEVWSPNGEARDLIRSLGLQHTSMSVGDVVVYDSGYRTYVYAVAPVGFTFAGYLPTEAVAS